MPPFNLNESWTIKSERLSWDPERHFRPKTKEELIKIIQVAEAAGKGIRAVGSGCSFSSVSIGDNYIVYTDDLSANLAFHIDGFPRIGALPLSDHAKKRYSGLIYVEAGIKLENLYNEINNLNTVLKTHGHGLTFALPTLGGAVSQSLGGAVSTGTHGSVINRKPLADWIRAVHLIGAGGKEFWIERSQSNNITEEDILRDSSILSDSAEVIYDDDVFFASIVAMGRFGIIYGLVYELVPNYWLTESVISEPWQTVRNNLSRKGVSNFVDHYGFYTDKAKTNDLIIYFSLGYLRSEKKMCYVSRRTPTAINVNRKPKLGLVNRCEIALGKLVHYWLAIVADDLLQGNPSSLLARSSTERAEFNNFIFENGFSDDFYVDEYYKILRNDTLPVDRLIADSAEYAFDASKNDYINFVDFVLQQVANPQMVGWLSIRFTPRSDALLGWQRFPLNAYIEIASIKDNHIDSYRKINRVALDYGGLPHWGQFHELTKDDVYRIYGEDLGKWKKALRKISRFGSHSTFSNDFTRKLDLEPSKENGTITWFSLFNA